MSDFQRVKTHLGRLSWSQLEEAAAKTKVSFHTLHKIATGKTDNPRVKTVEKLVKGLAL